MDIEKFAAAMAPVIRAQVDKATAPLLARITELEARGVPDFEGLKLAAAAVLPELVDKAQAALGERMASAIASIPVPQDGKSVAVEDVERMVQARVAGWALDFERRAQGVLERAVDRMPRPKDGEDGQDGADGIGFDDLTVEHDGERGIALKFTRADICREFRVDLPVVLDRGVYKEGSAYRRGDAVTWGGSLWIAQKDAPDSKPGMGDGWRLAVKKGRDGKDGK